MKKVKALVIDPFKQSIYQKEIRQDNAYDIQQVIGDYFEVGYRFDNGDTLFVDENGLAKDPQKRFRLKGENTDSLLLMPLSGKALLVGHDEEGSSQDHKTKELDLAMLIDWMP